MKMVFSVQQHVSRTLKANPGIASIPRDRGAERRIDSLNRLNFWMLASIGAKSMSSWLHGGIRDGDFYRIGAYRLCLKTHRIELPCSSEIRSSATSLKAASDALNNLLALAITGQNLGGESKVAMQNTATQMVSHAALMTNWLSAMKTKPILYQGQIWDIRVAQSLFCNLYGLPTLAIPAVELYRQLNDIHDVDALVEELQGRLGLKPVSALAEPELPGRSQLERRKLHCDAAGGYVASIPVFDRYSRPDHGVQVILKGQSKLLLPATAFAWRGDQCIFPHSLPPKAPFALFCSNVLAQNPGRPVLLTESIELAQALCPYYQGPDASLVPVSWFGGTEGISSADWSLIKGRNVYFAMVEQPEVGQTASQALLAAKTCAAKVCDHLRGLGAEVQILDFTKGAAGTPLDRQSLPVLVEKLAIPSPLVSPSVDDDEPLTLADLKESPAPESLIEPVIAVSEANLMSADAGVGKTWLSLRLACAVACGSQAFGHWRANRARPLLYVDGEMGMDALGRRLKKIAAGFDEEERQLISKNFHVVSIGAKAPNLAGENTQRELDAVVDKINRKSGYREKVGLIVLDNLVSLVPNSDTEAAWAGLCAWIQEKKRQGTAVLLVHHFGKSGQQRGTNLKMAAVDNAFSITPSSNGKQGAIAMAIAVDKGREMNAAAKKTIHVEFDLAASTADWRVLDDGELAEDDILRERLAELVAAGLGNAEIANELGLSLDQVKKRKSKFGLVQVAEKSHKAKRPGAKHPR